ncbi:hypothetical protein GCM10022226_60880 [Sphaerisporangium flaviroseum]|uniref:Uncharacterized protein n=1 Tax=Sphaerisporangium flaviroseum TaxID=509199 RepID=A0ABP7J1H8_9ACTN
MDTASTPAADCPTWCTSAHDAPATRDYHVHSVAWIDAPEGHDAVSVAVARIDTTPHGATPHIVITAHQRSDTTSATLPPADARALAVALTALRPSEETSALVQALTEAADMIDTIVAGQ